jgi:hypothetical protein
LASRGTPIVHIGGDNHQHIVLNIIRVRGEEVGVIAYHPTSDAKRNWMDLSSEIKQMFDSCELDRNNGMLTDEQYAEQMEQDWLPIVRAFILRFGRDLVRPDIREDLNDVERKLGLVVTEFNVLL